MKNTVLSIITGLLIAFPAFGLEVGDEAPCVVLDGVDAHGQDVRGCIRDQVDKNQGYTLIEFFSILCSTCQKNLPKVSKLAKEIAPYATVRLVSVDTDEAEIRAYLASEPAASLIDFPVAFDLDRDAKRAYDVFKTPTAFLLDKNNKVLFKHSGSVLSPANLNQIKALVGAPTGGNNGGGNSGGNGGGCGGGSCGGGSHSGGGSHGGGSCGGGF